MERIYYLVDSIENAEQLSNDLQREGLSRDNFHFIGKDESVMHKKHIPIASIFQKRNIAYGAVKGLFYGAIATTIVFLGSVVPLTSLGVSTAGQIVFFIFSSLSILLTAGLLGVLKEWPAEHYRVHHFHDHLEQGGYILQVDVVDEQISSIKHSLSMHKAKEAANDHGLLHEFSQKVFPGAVV